MDIYQVSPDSVVIGRECSKRDIEYQMARLVYEGQIEPIPVIPRKDGLFELNREHEDFWHYSDEQCIAAYALKWDKILVTY